MAIDVLNAWLWLNSNWPAFVGLAAGLAIVAAAIDFQKEN